MSWLENIKDKYSDLEFCDAEYINDPGSQLVIDDISCWLQGPSRSEVAQSLQDLEESCRGRLRVLSLLDLGVRLDQLIKGKLGTLDKNVLAVFPGDGAQTTRQALPFESDLLTLPSVNVEAKRMKDEQGIVQGIALPGAAEAIRQALGLMQNPKGVLVVDDVVDTGRTLLEIKSNTGVNDIPWYAVAPIMFSPLPYATESQRQASSSLAGVEKTFAALVLQGDKNPVDLNSLTSFVEGGKKTDRLIAKCLRNYICSSADELLFSRSLDQLQKFYMMTQEIRK